MKGKGNHVSATGLATGGSKSESLGRKDTAGKMAVVGENPVRKVKRESCGSGRSRRQRRAKLSQSLETPCLVHLVSEHGYCWGE